MHLNRLCNIFIAILINYTKSNEIYNTFEIDKNLTNANIFSELNETQQSTKINLEKELEKLNNHPDSISNQPHSRKKRLIWITDDGRLALPPGTSLSLSPSISLPFVRHPPEGFLSNLSINFPVTIDFDKLGLTDNQNPLGDLPPILARSFGKAAGSMLSSYVADFVNFRRSKRDLSNYEANGMKSEFDSKNQNRKEPSLPNNYKHAFHGGERVLIYGAIEDLLENFGVNGKACLLRTICEVHSKSLNNFGLIGEITKLFLTASLSPFSDHIGEYVEAEEIGKGNIKPGECFPYYKNCPKSIFKTYKNNYGKMNNLDDDKETKEKLIKSTKKPTLNKSTSYKKGDNSKSFNNKNMVLMKK
ncbi:uncharacterized protein LOC129612884 [Condylostylus longicornis]|uniref:uncharacterized protein LOC129612884 n=1 Tax=Condylostylus longicornis TaxID=2530218 RepID=UPI00244DFFC5|nr:uncharacterized protein LOC129612884 [Condylostylus longicornis]